MSTRQQSNIQTTHDWVRIVSAKGWLSGSGGDMAGPSVVSDGTDVKLAVTFGSSSLGLPSGSVRLTLPANNLYVKTIYWDVQPQMSGNVVNGASRISPYTLVKYGHNTVSGTFDFGVVANSGSTTAGGFDAYVGTVPVDAFHPNQPVMEFQFFAVVIDSKDNA